MYVFGPDGFQSPVKASKLAAGSYPRAVADRKRQGLFRVRPLVESRAFPEIGLYRQEEEMTEYGSNDFVAEADFGGDRRALQSQSQGRVRSARPEYSVDHGALAGIAGAGGAAESGGAGNAKGQEPVRKVSLHETT